MAAAPHYCTCIFTLVHVHISALVISFISLCRFSATSWRTSLCIWCISLYSYFYKRTSDLSQSSWPMSGVGFHLSWYTGTEPLWPSCFWPMQSPITNELETTEVQWYIILFYSSSRRGIESAWCGCDGLQASIRPSHFYSGSKVIK